MYGNRLLFVVHVMCSVPQGSVLGPLFFILYTRLQTVLPSTVSLHTYADDTQLHLHSRRDEMVSFADQFERCVLDIGHWIEAERGQDRTTVRQLRSLPCITERQLSSGEVRC